MKKIILILILIFILIVCGCSFYLLSGSPPKEDVSVYKGVWDPMFSWVFDIKRIKGNNVNTVSFGIDCRINEDGGVSPAMPMPLLKLLIILQIKAAHRNDLRVFLGPNTMAPGFPEHPSNPDLFFEDMTKISVEWAEIAERYGVELYTPLSEVTWIVQDREKVNKWSHDVAIKIKEVYSGKIVYQVTFEEWGLDNDYKGYDYAGFDPFLWEGQTLDEFREMIKENIADMQNYAERDGVPGIMIAEFGAQVGYEAPEVATRETPVSEQEQAMAYEILFEESAGKVDGYFACCWSIPAFGPKGMEAETVLKEWYGRIE